MEPFWPHFGLVLEGFLVFLQRLSAERRERREPTLENPVEILTQGALSFFSHLSQLCRKSARIRRKSARISPQSGQISPNQPQLRLNRAQHRKEVTETLPRQPPGAGRAAAAQGHKRSCGLAVSILGRLSPLSPCCCSLSSRSCSCCSCCSPCCRLACIAYTLSSLSRFPFHDSQVQTTPSFTENA